MSVRTRQGSTPVTRENDMADNTAPSIDTVRHEVYRPLGDRALSELLDRLKVDSPYAAILHIQHDGFDTSGPAHVARWVVVVKHPMSR